MGKKAKKPTGFNKFHSLLKRVVAVPKDKVDERIAQKKADSTDNPQKK